MYSSGTESNLYMAHFVSTTAPLTSKTISEESKEAVKFEAATETGFGEITAISGAVSLLTPGDVITAPGIFPSGTTVVSVDVAKKEAVLSQGALKEGTEKLEIKTPVFKPYIFTSQPVQTDFAEYVTGTVTADQVGSLEIQQSFNYPQDHEDDEKALENCHWDVATKIAIEAGKGKGFQVFTLAPYFRLAFTNEGEEQKELRAYARTQEKGRL